MAGLYRHIQACNNHQPADYLPLYVCGQKLGRVRPAFSRALAAAGGLFRVARARIDLDFPPQLQQQVTLQLQELLERLVKRGVIDALHGERYKVSAGWGAPVLLTIDRAAAPYFGLRTYGQHINGYVETVDGLMMWLGRRAADRKAFPGCLDNLAAGGVPYGLSLEENLVKECGEEAGIAQELAATATPVGMVSYNADSARGFKPDTLFCYDLSLPAEFIPRCVDGEVECFYLMPVEEVLDLVRYSDQFKPNCNLVMIDFFIRHGFVLPEDEEYFSLVHHLRPAIAPI